MQYKRVMKDSVEGFKILLDTDLKIILQD